MPTTLHHLQTLVGLGPRPIASPANQAAADYIRETFCAAGLEVEEQPDEAGGSHRVGEGIGRDF